MVEKLKILHVFRDISPQGGAARAMIALAKYSEHEHKILNLMPLKQGCVNHLLAHEAGIPVLWKNHLLNEIERADIVHLHWWQKPEIQRFLESKWPPMRLLIWTHVVGNKEPHIITSTLASFADMLVATGPQTLQEVPILQRMPVHTDWVYGPADFARLEGFTPKEHKGFNIGYIGSLSFNKMYQNFAELSMRISMSDVKFIVCGGGSGGGTLKEQTKDDGRFQFPGYVRDIKPWLEIFDIFGYPIITGSAELVLQEAMYCGVPPVVFNVGGLSRLVIDNYSGLVVRTEPEYVEAIRYLYYHPDERKRLGENAHHYASQVLGGENSAQKMDRIYSRLMAWPKKQRDYRHYISAQEEVQVPKKISIVFSGRNDDYGGDFKGRLLAAWTRNKKEFEERGIETEWIFVEWNPVDENYLSYELAPLGFRCYVVAPEVHERICTHPQMSFMQFFAKNVGLRRAKNHWILLTNPDCVFSGECQDFLAARTWDAYSMYRAGRRDIDPKHFGDDFPLMYLKTVQIHDTCRGHFPTQAAGDFVMFNKHTASFGYDESATFTDVGPDGRFIHNWATSETVPGKNQVKEIGAVFKADHPALFYKDEVAKAGKDTHKGQSGWDYKNDLPYVNKPTWGLFDSKLEPLAQNVWYVTDQHNLQKCSGWIAGIAKALEREHYHDQTPLSLLSLMNLVYEYQPTKIVELGTCFGTSLRGWLHAAPTTEITAIDISFRPLMASLEVLPVDLSHVRLLEQNVLSVDFSKLWNKDDIVLLYHDAHGAQLMEFILERVVPILPKGSVIAIDDLWYNPEKITSQTAPHVYQRLVVPEIDPEAGRSPKFFAPYWEGGSFFGYEEVTPLMDWAKRHRVSLVFNPGSKNVWWKIE